MNLDVKDKVGVYILHNQITDETYIGSGILNKRKFVHNNSLLKNKHFNKKLQTAYNKNPNFDFIGLPVNEIGFTLEENRVLALDLEQALINEHWGNPLLLNKAKNVEAPKTGTLTSEATKKIQSETALKLFKNGGRTAPWLNKNIPDYYKENISKSVKKHWESLSKEEQQKRTEGMISVLKGNTYSVGRIVSEETRVKLSVVGLGKIRSEESRNNISKGKTGVVFTDEHCKNLSVALTGKKQSPETIKKRSDSLKRFQLIKKGLI